MTGRSSSPPPPYTEVPSEHIETPEGQEGHDHPRTLLGVPVQYNSSVKGTVAPNDQFRQRIPRTPRELSLRNVVPMGLGKDIKFTQLEVLSLCETLDPDAPSNAKDAVTLEKVLLAKCEDVRTFLRAIFCAPLRRLSISLGGPRPAGLQPAQGMSVRALLQPLLSVPPACCDTLEELSIVSTGPGIITVEDEDIRSIAGAFPKLRILHLNCRPLVGPLLKPAYRLTCGALMGDLWTRRALQLEALSLPAFIPRLPWATEDAYLNDPNRPAPTTLRMLKVIRRDATRISSSFPFLKARLTPSRPIRSAPIETHQAYVKILRHHCPKLDAKKSLQALPSSDEGSEEERCAVQAWYNILSELTNQAHLRPDVPADNVDSKHE